MTVLNRRDFMVKAFFLCVSFVAFMLTACNNDIFVESENLPDVSYITLDGNGEVWSSAFSRKGLTRIYVNPEDSSDDGRYLTYYGVNGDVVDASCPFDELRDIQYDTPVRHYSISFYGGMIYITCHYNLFSEKWTAVYATSYDYTVDYEAVDYE